MMNYSKILINKAKLIIHYQNMLFLKYRENKNSLSKAIIDMISEIDGPLEKEIINKIEEINKSLWKIILIPLKKKINI